MSVVVYTLAYVTSISATLTFYFLADMTPSGVVRDVAVAVTQSVFWLNLIAWCVAALALT